MIQYPKLTHTTLPSIEGAFSTLNILRDPPKSIHTRYIEKVGDTNKITEQIDAAGDRFCEAILPFARGVNPMVDVSYSNYGTNGGQVRYQYGSSENRGIQSKQASLPYKVVRDGVFRPPILSPRELLPLSRLPRTSISHLTNPGSSATVNQVMQSLKCKPDLRAIRTELLNVCAPSKKSFVVETPHNEPYDVKYSIATKPVGMARTNLINLVGDGSLQQNKNPHKEVTNKTYSTVNSNAFKNIQTPFQKSSKGLQPIHVKSDTLKGSHNTNISMSGEKTNGSMNYRTLKRNNPLCSASTNIMSNRTNLDNTTMSREYTYLPERTSRGSFSNGGSISSFNRATVPIQSHQPSIKQKAYELSNQRTPF